MKYVINSDFGGFGLSHDALMMLGGPCADEFERNDPRLVEIVEKLGEDANDYISSLKVVEIPDGVDVMLHDYDGKESLHEVHRVWM